MFPDFGVLYISTKNQSLLLQKGAKISKSTILVQFFIKIAFKPHFTQIA